MSGEPVQNQKQTGVVRMERVFRHPPEAVWRALTDPKALAQWLLPTDFRAEIGHRFRFRQRSERGHTIRIDCRVVELEAPHRLAYLWHSEEESLPTLVTWTLEPVEAGTCLRVEHINPNGVQNEITSLSHSATLLIYQSFQGADEGDKSRITASRRVGRVILTNSRGSVRCIGRPITHATHADQAQKLACKEVSLCIR